MFISIVAVCNRNNYYIKENNDLNLDGARCLIISFAILSGPGTSLHFSVLIETSISDGISLILISWSLVSRLISSETQTEQSTIALLILSNKAVGKFLFYFLFNNIPC